MPIRREFRTISRLAAPVVLTQVGSMMLGVVDLLMLGHYNKEALAGSALARVWLFGTLIIAQGVLLGLDPMISQGHGAGDRRRIGEALQSGVLLALLLTVPLTIGWSFTATCLRGLGVEDRLADLGHQYALARIPGISAYLLFGVLRSWLQGRGIMRPAMWIVFAANGLNVLFNWVLIYGEWGFPELGIRGAGLATTLTQGFMVLALLLVVRIFRLHEGAWHGWSKAAWQRMREVLRHGLPVGVQLGVEIWAFQIATLMAAEFGTDAVAAHAIALNLASISFMVPLGISIGVSARVGNLVGALRPADAQRSANIAIVMGAGVMAVAAAIFVLGRDALPRLYNGDPVVVALTAAILPIAAAFQLFDGVQVVAGGVLRGMGRTRPLAVIHFIAFYMIGLPVAWLLAFRAEWGVTGVWWGLCLGLASVAVGLVLWVLRRGPATLTTV